MADAPGDRLQAAVKFAAKKHLGQWRDGDAALPYVTHPLRVLHLLRHEAGVVDEELLCSAVLHDVLEECDVTPEKLESKFGERVADVVRELTRREPEPEEVRGMDLEQLWKLRSELLLEDIRAMSPEAQTIKLCDRIDNLDEALRTRTGVRLDRYIRQSRLILQAIPSDVHPKLWSKLDAMVREAEEQLSD